MAQQQQHTPIEQVLELLTEQGSDGFAETLRLLLNLAMLFEREAFLQAAPYEPTPARRDLASGFKPKRLRTRLAAISTCVSRGYATQTSTPKHLNAAPVVRAP
jgi:putative transposase